MHMKSKKAKKKKSKKPASQAYLPINEIKEDVVIMKDGTFRSVLITSSINFALKSEEEQMALISNYVGFLNSLDFPMQIVVQSRRLRIQPYLDSLVQLENKQQNELLKVQISDYRSYIKELVEIGEIMTKKFYVVVPFDPMSSTKKTFWSRLKEVIHPIMTVRVKEERFLKRKEALMMRVRQVKNGLEGMGLGVTPLNSQALIELYYQTYNPEISFSEQLQDIDDVQVETI